MKKMTGKVGKNLVPLPLRTVLQDEGLSYVNLVELCPAQYRVGAKAISDVANGRRSGSVRSKSRILNAINNYPHKKRTYSWEDLFSEPKP